MVGSRSAQRGQASVELVALLPLLILVALIGWQLGVAGYAWTLASGAARAAARAQEVEAPAAAAARAVLPGRYARGARVRTGAGGEVRVRVAVPTVVPLLPGAGLRTVEARAAP
ncbi:MAG TPA: TadE/TadG family type IV pilus assembly protein [Miltoncostaeaceae bacterium]|jgi:TadE-like protein|nr:TadE/TadG family type IV pilus assembly protein [Miltoncostaeaceae bacterium]